MSDTNCNCCNCQYSTPPWWVTMGFTPPGNYPSQDVNYMPSPPAVENPPMRQPFQNNPQGPGPSGEYYPAGQPVHIAAPRPVNVPPPPGQHISTVHPPQFPIGAPPIGAVAAGPTEQNHPPKGGIAGAFFNAGSRLALPPTDIKHAILNAILPGIGNLIP